jgi:putative nucleotidyltransferase with HDIG domain
MASGNVSTSPAGILGRLSTITELKTVPASLHRILQEASDPDADIAEVADVIMQDQVLASKVLRFVNSPYFGLVREVVTLKQAIVLLGLRRIRDIVLTTLLVEAFPLRDVTLPATTFWAHALGCAQAAVLLDPEQRYPVDDLYYLAGLLHDLGEVVLAQYFPEEFSLVYGIARERQWSLYQAEKEVLEITHCEVGAVVARQWNFPEAVVEAIEYHHQPGKAPEDPILVSVVHLADLFSRLFGLNYGLYEKMLVTIREEESFQILKERYPDKMNRDWEKFSLDVMERFREIGKSVKMVFGET